MKVLYIIPSFLNAGPVNVCLTLSQELSEMRNIDIHVYALKSGDKENIFKSVGCHTEVFSLHSILKMISKIKSEGFDIIHSHCLVPDFILSLIPTKCIKISTIHNFIDIDYIYSKGGLVGRLMGVVNRVSLNKMDMVVGCSKSVSEYCLKNYNIKNISYIRNGVLDDFDGQYLRRKKRKSFFYLGVINERKNVSIILDSFLKWNENKYHTLHIIGGGEQLVKYKELYGNKNITFYGNIPSPLSLIKSMDCFVSSSKAEGLPLALLESLCLGKQFICSNIPPHQEIITLCKSNTGVIVDNTIDGFIKGFESLDIFDIEASSYSARKAYANHFSSKVMAKKYHELYMDLLSNK
ncbi:glycosyltransferase family 4 protein [Yersinia ruckeri]|uniref:glycosyltransferase family 4 protein n=2 Tax=Yersinia ruckeri TaxID=29486 RepID=UPI002264D78D|nr:glycosyltransferase family 4 protein [Yersinia ruckeri]UZX54511.1 glycosyltransferase family 4 protein [Yersinia ruckeri]